MIESPANGSQEANLEFNVAGTTVVGELSHVPLMRFLYSKAPPLYQKATRAFELDAEDICGADGNPEPWMVVAADQLPLAYVFA